MSIITKLLENSEIAKTEFIVLDRDRWIDEDGVNYISSFPNAYKSQEAEVAEKFLYKVSKAEGVPIHGRYDLYIFPPCQELTTLRAVVPKNQLFDLLMAEKANYEYYRCLMNMVTDFTRYSPNKPPMS